jgi:hypothetical protein
MAFDARLRLRTRSVQQIDQWVRHEVHLALEVVSLQRQIDHINDHRVKLVRPLLEDLEQIILVQAVRLDVLAGRKLTCPLDD